MFNKHWKLLSFLGALLFFAACGERPSENLSSTQLFNDSWKFTRVTDSLQAFSPTNTWEEVMLPHTPVTEPLVVNNQWQGICWYKKSFQIDDHQSGQRLFLKFDGAMMVADVWINGVKKATHLGGFLPFTIDITEQVQKGKANEVIVRLDNTDNPVTGPKPLNILDFNMYGGLYRDVHLLMKGPVYITDPMTENSPAGGGIFVTYPTVDSTSATIQIKTQIRNSSSNNKKVVLKQTLWLENQVVSQTESKPQALQEGQSESHLQNIVIENPQLWSPRSPRLYKLITGLLVDDRLMDQEITMLGIKNIEFQNNQLVLNGKKVFLRGVNRHQEYPYIGYALSNEAQYRDAVKIKEAGFDYVRLSHYPHSPAFMDACDEIGLLVIDAILGWQYYSDNREFQSHIYETAKNLIRRDRNHACVLAWEVSLNESWMPESFIDSLTQIAHQEYPGDQCFTAGWQDYGYDIYLQARQHRLKHYEEPDKPYVVSEYGDWEYYAQNAGLNQDSWQDLQEDERTSRQLLSTGEKRLLQQATNIQEAHNDNLNTPAFADGYWVMFDYNRGYADDLEASGIMSINRLPKFSYYFFQSQRDPDEKSNSFSSGPMVFIASYWNEASSQEVRILSNCEEVELYLNDSMIGRQKPDINTMTTNLAHPPFTFEIDSFIPGSLKAKGFIQGEEAALHQRKTPGEPAGIILWLDESGRSPKADVNDVVFVYAALVDSNQTLVPVNDFPVAFSIEGIAELVSPETINSEAGISAALIRIGSQPGSITVKARGRNLNEGVFTFQSK